VNKVNGGDIAFIGLCVCTQLTGQSNANSSKTVKDTGFKFDACF